MLGAIATWGLRFAAVVCGVMLLAATTRAQSSSEPGIHLGVATCSGSNCHGAMERPPGSAVPGDEFIIWSKRDKHRQAYTVLLEPRAVHMAQAIGLPDAAHQTLCLNCHADNVPPDRRGREFQLSDGVGCEACHGGASGWLGIHISGASHQQNVAAGLYPTDQPVARAEKCLSCHFGDSTRFVDHRLYGAGHPRLAFELDTYTAIEPAHFVVDQSYIDRKGRVGDVQVWAAGQAIALRRRMDALLDPRHVPHGLFPEFALFDCQSCHHPYDSLHAPLPSAGGLGPGTVKLYDANALMLGLAASRAAPEAARALAAHMLALDRATTENWPTVQKEAAAVRQIAGDLAPLLGSYDFTPDDMQALFEAQIRLGTASGDWRFSHGEQITMALEAIVANLKTAGYVGDEQAEAMTDALGPLYRSFLNDEFFRPSAFAKALKSLQLAPER